MTAEPKFRLARPDDLAIVESLTERAFRDYALLLGGLPVPVTEDYVPRIADGGVWMLEVGDDIAGLAVIEHHADHLELFNLAVSPDHQSAGHGRRILAFLEDQARAAGLPEIRLYTNARMERTIAIYLAYGFREVSRRLNPLRPTWTIVDMVKSV